MVSLAAGIRCDPGRCRTNLVYFEVEEGVDGEALVRELREQHNVLIGGGWADTQGRSRAGRDAYVVSGQVVCEGLGSIGGVRPCS